MWKYCEAVNGSAESIYLYGSTEQTLAGLKANLLRAFPGLKVAGVYSPPFRPLTEEEEDAVAVMINSSGANIVFVGLGCPKQERWMAAQRGRIHAVMIGVGAAFDYHAGITRRAPQWMQRWGLEWLHRLASEPRRLWRRYLVTNTLFILSAVTQLLGRQR
jgi:N-acetylglucosaminyldiphosphoundecaprenol N-acetyl-beta-D-mannosaminyltransferase